MKGDLFSLNPEGCDSDSGTVSMLPNVTSANFVSDKKSGFSCPAIAISKRESVWFRTELSVSLSASVVVFQFLEVVFDLSGITIPSLDLFIWSVHRMLVFNSFGSPKKLWGRLNHIAKCFSIPLGSPCKFFNFVLIPNVRGDQPLMQSVNMFHKPLALPVIRFNAVAVFL